MQLYASRPKKGRRCAQSPMMRAPPPAEVHHSFAARLRSGRPWNELVRRAIVKTAGLTWEWESFPDFMDALERRERAIDIAAQAAHLPCAFM
jgi:hypothetical protein